MPRPVLAAARRALPAAPLLLALALALAPSLGPVAAVERWARGRLQAAAPQRAASGDVQLVTVTNHCVEALQRWPLRRREYARLLDRLRRAGAKAVALDVLLDTPGGEGQEEDDRLLAEAVSRSGCVVLASLARFETALAPDMGLRTTLRLTEPVGSLRSAARAVGFANVELLGLNSVASLERAPLVLDAGEPRGRLGSFAYEAARAFDPTLADDLPRSARWSPPSGPGAPPATDLRYVWIDYRAARAEGIERPVPFTAVLDGSFPPGLFRGRLVVVGTEATGTQDVKDTPVGPLPGVAINACIAAALLDGTWLRRAPEAASPVGLLVGGPLLLVLLRRRRRAGLLVALCALPLGSLGLAWLLLDRWNLLLDPVLPAALGLGMPVADLVAAAAARRLDDLLDRTWREAEDPAFVAARAALDRCEFEPALVAFQKLVESRGEAARESRLLALQCLLGLGREVPARRAFHALTLDQYDVATVTGLGRLLTAGDVLDCAEEALAHAYGRRADAPDVAGLLDEVGRRRTALLTDPESPAAPAFPARYQDVRFAGGGGMARVYRAWDTERGELVALKVLAASYRTDATVSKRFAREVQATRELDHPNVVKVFEVGEGAVPYYSMEFLGGRNLRHAMSEGPMPLGRAAPILRSLLSALSYAHERGVIHRDVKPENVMLEEGDVVKLVDFGLARLALLTSITVEGTAMGTPWYMAPEQFKGTEVDSRADLYAWAVVFFEALTGQLPYPKEAVGLKAVLPPRLLKDYLPGVPAPLDALVDRCLATSPGDRPATCAEVLLALDVALAGAKPA